MKLTSLDIISKTTVALLSRGKVDLLKTELAIPNSDTYVIFETLYSGISAGTEKKTVLGNIPTTKKKWISEYRYFKEEKSLAKYPKYLGYECVGKVIKKGKAVNSLKVGDVAWLDAPHSTFHVIDHSETHLFLKIPKTLNPMLAVFLPEIRVALGGIHDANIHLGDKVSVVGQGVIGIITAYLARLSGANVFTFEINDVRAALSKKLHFNCINPAKVKDVAGHLRTILGITKGVDSVIETSGDYDGLKLALKLPAMTGRVVTVSSYTSKKIIPTFDEEWHKNKLTLISSMTINECPHPNYPLWDLPRLNQTSLEILVNNQDFFSKLISHKFPIHKATEAYKLLLEKQSSSIKILFTY